MAKLEKINNNNFTTTDMNAMFLDNNIFDPIRKNVLASVADLTLPSEAVYAMEDGINGTESVQLLINQWHEVKRTTDNFRNLYVDDVDPAIVRVRDSMLQKDEEIAQQLNFEGADFNTFLSATASNITKKITNATQLILKGLPLDEDDYAEYMTDDAEVNAAIIELFSTYGDDLSGMQGLNWDDITEGDENKKKALGRIMDVGSDFIEGHLSNKKSDIYEKQVGNILQSCMSRLEPESEGYVFLGKYINDLQNYVSSDAGQQYIEELKELNFANMDCPVGVYTVDIKIDGVGVIFSLKNGDDLYEINCHTSEDRTRKCINYWEKQNPGCFDHEYSLLKNGNANADAKEELVTLFTQAQNSYDCEFLQRLFKSDATYSDVFTDDPEKLSANVQLIVGNHMNILASDNYNGTNYQEYQDFINAAIDAKYESGDVLYYRTEDNLKFLTISSSMAADAYRASAWDVDLENCDDFERQFNIASHNELLMFALYSEYGKADAYKRLESIELGNDFDFTDADCFYINYSKTETEETSTTGVTSYGTPYQSHIESVQEKIDIDESIGSAGGNDLSQQKLREALEEKETSEQKLYLDASVDVIKIFCPEAGEALEKVEKVMSTVSQESYANDAKDTVVGQGKKSDNTAIKTGVTLFSAFDKYNQIQQKYQKAYDEEIEREMVNTFFSNMNYCVEGTAADHYVAMNFEAIKLIREWDEQGISVIYEKTEGKEYGVSVENICIEYFNNNSDSIKDDVKKALNTIIYGANPNYDTYDSIADIPTEILVQSFNILDGNMKGARAIENQIITVLDPNE